MGGVSPHLDLDSITGLARASIFTFLFGLPKFLTSRKFMIQLLLMGSWGETMWGIRIYLAAVFLMIGFIMLFINWFHSL
jgi:hypothetical protein